MMRNALVQGAVKGAVAAGEVSLLKIFRVEIRHHLQSTLAHIGDAFTLFDAENKWFAPVGDPEGQTTDVRIFLVITLDGSQGHVVEDHRTARCR